MIDRNIDNKSVIKTKIEDDVPFISTIEISSKIKFKVDNKEDSYYLCENSRELAGDIGKAIELKIEELLREFTNLSYSKGASQLLKAIEETLITTVD